MSEEQRTEAAHQLIHFAMENEANGPLAARCARTGGGPTSDGSSPVADQGNGNAPDETDGIGGPFRWGYVLNCAQEHFMGMLTGTWPPEKLVAIDHPSAAGDRCGGRF